MQNKAVLGTLTHGLYPIFIENPSLPLFPIEIAVRIGAFTEPPEFDGFSPLYEPMFFKANKTIPIQEAYLARQRELLGRAIAQSAVVITAAVIPGKRSPVLVTRDMVHGMAPGSVVVDLAAERGGNCEITQPGERVVEGGVNVIGRINMASAVPHDASYMYARNLTAFLLHLVKEGRLQLNLEDEITRETLLTRDGQWRKRRDKTLGFPSDKALGDPELQKAPKAELAALLGARAPAPATPGASAARRLASAASETKVKSRVRSPSP